MTKKVKKPAKLLTLTQIKKLVGKPQAAPQALTSLHKLFEGGDRWVKQMEHDEGRTKFCLIGGVHLVDGPSEEEVGVCLALAILKRFPKRLSDRKSPQFTLKEAIRHLRDVEYDGSLNYEVWLSYLKDGFISYGDIIPAFNDHELTTHKDVLAVIKDARDWVKKLEAIKEQFGLIEEWKHSIASGLAKLFPKKKKVKSRR